MIEHAPNPGQAMAEALAGKTIRLLPRTAYGWVDGELVSHRRIRRHLARHLSGRSGVPVRCTHLGDGTVRLYSPKGQAWALPFWDCRPAETVVRDAVAEVLAHHGLPAEQGRILVDGALALLQRGPERKAAQARLAKAFAAQREKLAAKLGETLGGPR